MQGNIISLICNRVVVSTEAQEYLTEIRYLRELQEADDLREDEHGNGLVQLRS